MDLDLSTIVSVAGRTVADEGLQALAARLGKKLPKSMSTTEMKYFGSPEGSRSSVTVSCAQTTVPSPRT